MSKQLEALPSYEEGNHLYLADGIIRLYGLKSIEVLLLETSGCFSNKDRSKIGFDHHKDLFGAFVMLKSIADEFSLASVNAFKTYKILFVHGSADGLGENVYLWSLRFEPKGPIYGLWLEDMLPIKPDIDDKLDTLPSFLRFFWAMKIFVALYCLFE
ncbi:hypothetical protein G6F62_009748 [Rhizopus arrhizus]|nr:hypothetical protein G6F62_009748 [Rhizopus arrhizus]